MNYLAYSDVYLAGPMDRVKDNGVTWRRHMTKFLFSLSIGVLDPTNKPIDRANESSNFQSHKHTLKKRGRWKDLSKKMKEIVAIDLRMVDKADFIILHVDTDVHMCGSYGEQSHGCLQRKPIIIHCPQGKAGVPDWLFGICNHKYFFDSWQKVKNCIIRINSKGTSDKNWKLFKYSKLFHDKQFNIYNNNISKDNI